MDLKDVVVSQVALGKAHAVALTNKGHVYTFGINNKGQCGRDLIPQVKESKLELASSFKSFQRGASGPPSHRGGGPPPAFGYLRQGRQGLERYRPDAPPRLKGL